MAFSRMGKAILVLLIAVLTVLACMVGSAIAAEGENDSRAITDKVQYAADPSTALNGRSILGTEGGRYAGRVWSDKSVYTDGSVDLGDGIRVEKGNADFLTVFSALGSSRNLTSRVRLPLDVVFVIDISGSMTTSLGNSTRIASTAAAVNDAIATLMDEKQVSKYSRVGVVVFSSDGYTRNAAVPILPLGRYEAIQEINGEPVYISMEENKLKLSAHGDDGIDYEESYSIEGGTNTQMGIYTGMKMLAEETDVTADLGKGITVSRIPAVVLLSDGEPTFSSRGEWWNPSTVEQGPGNKAFYGNGMLAMMTAAYMKDAVDRKYEVFSHESPEEQARYETKIYTVGMGLDERGTSDADRLAQVSLNPTAHLNDNNGMARDIRSAWTSYVAGNTPQITVNDERPRTYSLIHPSSNDISSNSDALQYNDAYYAADQNVGEVFQNIIEVLTNNAFVPTQDTAGTSSQTGLLYTDPIGDYMQVKEVQSVVLFGKTYPVSYDSKTGQYTVQNVSVPHPVTGTMFNTGSIRISVTTDPNNSRQTLTVAIPSDVLPIRCETIDVDIDNNVQSYSTNAGSPSSSPLRVIYTVSISDNLKNADGSIDLSKVDPAYIRANTDANGMVNFYTNAYQASSANGLATVEFSPSLENRYYYFQVPRVIFANATEVNKDGEADLTVNGKAVGDASVSNPVTTNNLDPNTNYYLVIDYYRPGADGQGEYVQHIVRRTGAELANSVELTNTANIGSNDPDGHPDYIATGTGEQVLATKVGGVRLGRLNRFTDPKDANVTGTAVNAYAPTYTGGTSSEDPTGGDTFTVYLGNNGRASVPTTSLFVGKSVQAQEGVTAPEREFDFKVTLEATNASEDPAQTLEAQLYRWTVPAGGDSHAGSYEAVRDDQGNPVMRDVQFAYDANENTLSADFKLKDGEALLFTNLAPGSSYTVAENTDNLNIVSDVNDNTTHGFKFVQLEQNGVVVTAAEGEGTAPQNATQATGTIEAYGQQRVIATNEYVSTVARVTLPITKELSGRMFQPGDSFTFTVMPSSLVSGGPQPTDTPLPTDANGNPVTSFTFTPTDDEIKEGNNRGTIDILANAPITFTKPGTYTYIIQEQQGNIAGITYDDTLYRVTVEVVAVDENGNPSNTGSFLKAERVGLQKAELVNGMPVWSDEELPVDTDFVFTNEYSATATSVYIPIHKTLNGQALGEGDFQFILEAVGSRVHGSGSAWSVDQNQPLPGGTPDNQVTVGTNNGIRTVEVSNGSHGNAVFADILFTAEEAGALDPTDPRVGIDYLYRVSEKQPENLNGAVKGEDGLWKYQGVTYSANTYDIIVHVYTSQDTHDPSQRVVSAMFLNADGESANLSPLEFVNTYSAQTTVELLGGTKTITGREFKAGDEFTFATTAARAGIPMPDPATSTISPFEGDSETFSMGAITFTEEDAARSNGDGTGRGRHYYYISENRGNIGGISYDPAWYRIAIDVVDDGLGNLTTTVVEVAKDATGAGVTGSFEEIPMPDGGWTLAAIQEHVVFTNEYHAAPVVSEALIGTKELVGRALHAGDFSFVIRAADANGNLLDSIPAGVELLNGAAVPGSVSNGEVYETTGDVAKADVTFLSPADIRYTQPGHYYYLVSEVKPAAIDPNMIYSDVRYLVDVDVIDNGNGALEIKTASVKSQQGSNGGWTEVAAPEGGWTTDALKSNVAFVNTYVASSNSVDINVTKQLNGRAMVADEFRFSIQGRSADGTLIDLPVPLNGFNTAAADGIAAPVIFDKQEGQSSHTFMYDLASLAAAVQDGYAVRDMVDGHARWTVSYRVSELTRPQWPAGVTPKDNRLFYDFDIVVTDNGNGALTAALAENTPSFAFVNEYGNTKEVSDQSGNNVDRKQVAVDDVLTYKVNWANDARDADGTFVAATVTVEDVLPQGLEVVEHDGATYNEQTRTLTWVISATPAQQGTVVFTARVTEAAIGVAVDNQATVNGNPTNKVTVTAPGKTVESDAGALEGLRVGDELTYTIAYTNITESEQDVVITDTVPAGTTFVEATPHAQGPDANGTVTWTLEKVAPGTAGQVTMKVKVNESAYQTDSISNTARVQIGDDDPAVKTNTTETSLSTGTLTITKAVDGEGAPADALFTFDIVLTSKGTPLTGTYSYTLEEGGTAIPLTLQDGRCTLSITAGQTATIAGLPEGTHYTVTERTGEMPLGFELVSAEGNEGDIVANAAVNAVITNRFANVPGPEKTVSVPNDPSGSMASVGDVLTYKISWANTAVADGKAVAAKVTVTDVVPTGTTYEDGSARLLDAQGNEVAGFNGFSIAGDTLTWSIEAEARQSGYVTFKVKVDESALETNTVTNAAQVKVGENGPAIDTNPTETSIPSKTVESDKGLTDGLKVGDLLTYTMEFANYSGADQLYVVTDRIPAGTEFVSAAYADGSDAGQPVGGVMTWNVNLSNGEKSHVTLRVCVGEQAYEQDTLNNTASVQIGENGPTISTNPVNIDARKADLQITKSVVAANGVVAPDAEFTFEITLTDADGEGLTGEYAYKIDDGAESALKANQAGVYEIALKSGQIATILGLPEGTSFAVREIELPAGFSQVAPADGGSAEGTVTKDGAKAEFVNEYHAEGVTVEGAVQLTGTKVLEGRNQVAGEFAFELTAAAGDKATADAIANGSVVLGGVPGAASMLARNNADGSWHFGDVSFSTTGTYLFTVREVEMLLGSVNVVPGVTYDKHTYDVKVVVTDDGKGKLMAEVQGVPEGGFAFKNIYASDVRTTPHVDGRKVLEGRTLQEHEFSFALSGYGIVGEAVATNDANGGFGFDLPTLTMADLAGAAPDAQGVRTATFEYQLREVVPADGNKRQNVAYSSESYKLTVTLTDNGKGMLTSTVSAVNSAGNAVETLAGEQTGLQFVNTYTPNKISDPVVLSATKTLVGRDLAERSFSFVVEDADGNQVSAGSNAAAQKGDDNASHGAVTFTPIPYDAASMVDAVQHEDGTRSKDFSYVMREVNPGEGRVPGVDSYDGRTYRVVVTVTDDGLGELNASVSYFDAEGNSLDSTPEFVNHYSVDDGKFTPVGISKVTDALAETNLDDLTFGYAIYRQGDPNKKPVATGTSGANGLVTFESIPVDSVGEFWYEIVEDRQGVPAGGVIYDGSVYRLQLVVTDAGDGTYAIAPSYYLVSADGASVPLGDGAYPVFHNVYDTEDLYVSIDGVGKLVNGGAPGDREFQFELIDDATGVVQYGRNDAEGNVIFGDLHYEYRVSEKPEAPSEGDEPTDVNGAEPEDPGQTGEPEQPQEPVAPEVPAPEGPSEQPSPEEPELPDEPVDNTNEENPAAPDVPADSANTEGSADVVTPEGPATSDESLTPEVLDESQAETSGEGGEAHLASDLLGATVAYATDESAETQVFEGPASVLDGNANADEEVGAEAITDPMATVQPEAPADSALAEQPGAPAETDSVSSDLGEHWYTIREVVPDGATHNDDGSWTYRGVTYDTATYRLCIEVSEADGALSADVKEIWYINGDDQHRVTSLGDVVFRNTYAPTEPVSVALEASKTLAGRDASDEEFGFVVRDGNGAVVSTGMSQGAAESQAAAVEFVPLWFGRAGVYSFTIEEVRGGQTLAGVTYDGQHAAVRVTVTDLGDGTLVAAVEYLGADGTVLMAPPAFANRYAVEKEGMASLEVGKILSGRDGVDGEFSFAVYSGEALVAGGQSPALKDGEAATFGLGNVYFARPGEYDLTVVETATTSNTGVSYDSARFDVHVTVTDAGDGTLSCEVSYPEGGVVFKNAYEADPATVALVADKTLTGRDLVAGEFSFRVSDPGSGALVTTGVNDGEGLVYFEEFELAEPGSYDFEIGEVAGTELGMEYDGRTFAAHVEVTDDGAGQLRAEVTYPGGNARFRNVFTPQEGPGEDPEPTTPDGGGNQPGGNQPGGNQPAVPKTADETPAGSVPGAFGLLGAALAGAGALLVRKNRRDQGSERH